MLLFLSVPEVPHSDWVCIGKCSYWSCGAGSVSESEWSELWHKQAEFKVLVTSLHPERSFLLEAAESSLQTWAACPPKTTWGGKSYLG
ncbi:uncharacterized protein ACIBXB_012289 isoform 2-T2 [Morphnus guianensis]